MTSLSVCGTFVDVHAALHLSVRRSTGKRVRVRAACQRDTGQVLIDGRAFVLTGLRSGFTLREIWFLTLPTVAASAGAGGCVLRGCTDTMQHVCAF